MRRMIFALIVMLGLPAPTVGQHVSAGAIGSIAPAGDPVPNWFIRPLIGPTSAGYPPRDPVPNFAIPPLIGPSSVGLPLPPIGLRPHIEDKVYRHGRDYRQRPVFVYPPMIYFVPHYAVSIAQTAAPELAPIKNEPAIGSLVLQVEPGSAQVFVDGYYVGTADDFNAKRGELVMEIGPHRIDINAPGIESVKFDVMISPSQSIVYRRVLKAVEITPPPAMPIPTTPRSFYQVPGCYMGNVPPKDAGLPATCDVSRAVTYTIN
jgi:hypothetical protein